MRIRLAVVVPLALGCGSAEPAPTPKTQPARTHPAPGVTPTMPATEVNQLQPRRDPPGVVVAGNQAARYQPRDGGVVEVWDLAKRTIATSIPVGASLALTTQGDAIVVLVNEPSKNAARLVTVGAGAKPVTVSGSAIVGPARRILVTARDLFVADEHGLGRLDRASLELKGALTWTGDAAKTSIAFGSDVLYAKSGALVRVDPAMKQTEYAVDLPGSLLHLAVAGADRVWATTATSVHLLALEAGKARHVHDVPLPGVYHVAAAGGSLAVLTVAMNAGAWAKLTLALVGPDGKITWTKELPLPKQSPSVAASASHVAVLVEGQLHVFAVAGGKAELP